MQNANPYGAPDAAVAEVMVDGNLAGRGERLGAALIDAAMMMAIVMPMMFLGGYWTQVMAAAEAGQKVAASTQVMWGLVGFAVFLLVQGYPLAKGAQTWGKRMLGLRIVGLDGSQPTLAQLVLKRYLPMQGLALIPLAGNLLATINVLLIFRRDRRCGHDLVAGTQVVRAR